MKERISLYQTALLLAVTVVPTAIVFLPSVAIERAARDAWISGLLMILGGLILSALYTALIKKMGSMDFIEFNKKVLGKWLTYLLGINLIIYFVLSAGVIIRETTEVVIANYLPLTPLWFLNMTMILVGVIFVFYGLECMARTVEILFYLFLGIFLLVMLMVIDELDPQFLQPVMARGIKPVISGTFPGLIFFSELFIILFWSPNLKKRKKVHKALLAGTFISGLIFMLVICYSIMLFGASLADELALPLITQVSYVSKLDVFERLDPLVLFFWVGGGIGKVTIFMYGALYTGQKLLKLPTYYKLIFPILPPVFYFSYYYFPNITEINKFLSNTYPYYLAIQFLYPLLLYIVSFIRKKNIS